MYVLCVFGKQNALVFQHRRFYVRTYILWATAGTTSKNCGESAQSEHKANPNDESSTTSAA